MTTFTRKYHPWRIAASVSATPDFEVSTDGSVDFNGAVSFSGIVSVGTVDFNGTPIFSGIVSASVSNPTDMTMQRMLRISNGTENFYVVAITSASVRF